MKKTILFLAILSIAGCGNSADSSDDFVESGNEYFENGNYDKARLEYKNAIQIDPRQAEPYYRLALIDEQNKNWKQMFANLTTVEQLDPNHADALVKLGRLYLLGGQIDDALTRTNKALEIKPDDFNAQVLKASIFAKQKKFDEASALLAEIAKDYPDHKDILSLDILISKDKGDLQTALEKSKAAVAKYPEDMSLRLIQLTLYNEMKDYNGMASVYEAMLQRKPDEREIVISYARLLVTMLNKYQEAMQVVETYLANHPDDSDVQQMLLALIDQKDPQEALVKLDEMIKASPDNYELKFAKAAFLDKNGDRNASVEQLNKIVSEDPQGLNGNRARVMLANYYASQQDLAKASELAEAVLAVAPEESGALLVRAKINLANDKVDQAVTDLRTVIRNTPESDEALLLLAQAYQKQGSEELAADSYRQALTANPYNPIAAAIVASNLVKEPNYARAEQVLIKALEKNQTNVNLLQQLAQIRILKKDWAAGIETIDMLKDQQGDTVLSLMLSGQLYQAQGDYSTAKQEYMAVLEKQPNMSQAMEGLAVSMEALSENAELEAYLTEFNNTHPDLVVGYATLAIHYFRIEKSDEAIALLNKKTSEIKDWALGYSLLIDYYLNNDKLPEAKEVMKKAIANVADNIRFLLQLASVEETEGNYTEAKKLYESILNKNNSVDIAANNLASLLTDQFESADNLQQALTLSQRFKTSTQPFFLDTYGWVNYKLGNLSVAKSALEQAVALDSSISVFHYHLGMLYIEQADEAAAREALNTAQQQASNENNESLLAEIEKALSNLGSN